MRALPSIAVTSTTARGVVVVVWTMMLLLLMPAAASAQASVDVGSVSEKIMCQCGCGAVLENCPHQECGWGVPAKAFIREQLESGRTSAELIEYYVSQNGVEILAAPEKGGFGLTAWLTPFAVLLSAAGALYFLVRMWADERRGSPEPVEIESNLPSEKLERLERELRTFD